VAGRVGRCDEWGLPHRISAAALRRRGLAHTTGHGATWSALLTSAGQDYLAHVDSPEPPTPRQANVSVTEQLVEDVIAAGGSRRYPQKRWYREGEIDYERRARLAEVYGKVPADKRLVVRRVSHEEIQVALEDAPGYVGGRLEVTPVAVPAKVGRYHSAARAFRDRRERHEVSRAQLARGVRLVHAIAVEADRRGWVAECPAPSSTDEYGRRQGWTATKHGHLQIRAGNERFWFRLHEEGVHTRGPWDEEAERYRTYSSSYRDQRPAPGPYDADGTGKLELELHSARWTSGRQRRWGDRASWTLEERIPDLFRELAERLDEGTREDQAKRLAEERAAEDTRRAAEERERQWVVLMREAREALLEAHRATQLQEQAQAWQTAAELRRYCDAVESEHAGHPGTDEWLGWARSYIAALDPLTEPPRVPDPPVETVDALQAHLPAGWSATGPHDRGTTSPTVPSARGIHQPAIFL
jgi:hypothetical protein